MRAMYQIRGAALGAYCLGADVLPNSALLTDAFNSLRSHTARQNANVKTHLQMNAHCAPAPQPSGHRTVPALAQVQRSAGALRGTLAPLGRSSVRGPKAAQIRQRRAEV